jgi:hypothetical protein
MRAIARDERWSKRTYQRFMRAILLNPLDSGVRLDDFRTPLGNINVSKFLEAADMARFQSLSPEEKDAEIALYERGGYLRFCNRRSKRTEADYKRNRLAHDDMKKWQEEEKKAYDALITSSRAE